jgi:hypothetical protein
MNIVNEDFDAIAAHHWQTDRDQRNHQRDIKTLTRPQVALGVCTNLEACADFGYSTPVLTLNDDLHLVFPFGFRTVNSQSKSQRCIHRRRELRAIKAGDASAKHMEKSLADRRRVA